MTTAVVVPDLVVPDTQTLVAAADAYETVMSVSTQGFVPREQVDALETLVDSGVLLDFTRRTLGLMPKAKPAEAVALCVLQGYLLGLLAARQALLDEEDFA